MKHLQKLSLFAFVLILASCGKQAVLEVSQDDMLTLEQFTDEMEAYTDMAASVTQEDIDLLEAVYFTNECDPTNSGSIIILNDTRLSLNRIMNNLGRTTPRQLHDWMVTNGKLVYDIRMANRDEFEDLDVFIGELACTLMPDLMSRTSAKECEKTAAVDMLKDAFIMGRAYGLSFSRVSDNTQVNEVTYINEGSALHRVWNQYRRVQDCNN